MLSAVPAFFPQMFFIHELEPGRVPPDIPYEQNDFFAMNFDDLAHSLVSLFHQLVVNDWWVVMEAVVSRVGPGAHLFFTSFYGVSTLAVFSVCTAFVVEAYMDIYQTKKDTAATGKAAIEVFSPSNRGPSSSPNSSRGMSRLDVDSVVAGATGAASSPLTLPRSQSSSSSYGAVSFRQFQQAWHRERTAQQAEAAAAAGVHPTNDSAGESTSPVSTNSGTKLVYSSGAKRGGSSSEESLVLSRISAHAAVHGLRVTLRQSTGLRSTLAKVFGEAAAQAAAEAANAASASELKLNDDILDDVDEEA